MQAEIAKLKKLCYDKREMIVSATGLAKDSPEPNLSIINTIALLNEIEVFYHSGKARFLPKRITEDTRKPIRQLINNLQSIDGHGVGQSKIIDNTLHEMEVLYAHCLKYGLVTFGFDAKEKSKLIQDIKNKAHDINSLLDKLKLDIENIGKEKREVISTQVESSVREMNEIFNSFKDKVEEQKVNIQQRENEGQEIIESIKKTQSSAFGITQEISNTLEAAKSTDQDIHKSQQEIVRIKADVDSELKSAQQAFRQTQDHAESSLEMVEKVQAQNESAASILMNIEHIKQQISGFYDDIEHHKDEMARARTTIEEDYAAFTEQGRAQLEGYRGRVEQIVRENESLQGRINELLERAQGSQSSAAAAEQEVGRMLEAVQARREEIDKSQQEADQIKTDMDSRLQSAQEVLGQTQEQSERSLELAEEVQAKSALAETALGNIGQIEGQISEFYDDIEHHKDEMARARTTLEENYAAFTEQGRTQLEGYRERVEQIVRENESLQGRINELLERAQGSQSSVVAAEQDVGRILEAVQARREEIDKSRREAIQIKTDMDSRLQSAQEALGQTQEQSERSLALAEEVQAKNASAETALGNIGQIEGQISDFYHGIEHHKAEMARARTTLEENYAAFTEQGRAQLEGYQGRVEQIVRENESLQGRINELLERAQGSQSSAAAAEQEVGRTLEAVQARQEEIDKSRQEAVQIKTDMDSRLQSAQQALEQAEEQAERSLALAEEVQAKNASAETALGNIEQIKQQIADFYNDLESYKAEMAVLKKSMAESYVVFTEESNEKIEDYSERTGRIVENNEALQARIAEFLGGAVGGGLSEEFRKRQEQISRHRHFWKWAVAVTSGTFVLGIILMTWLIGSKAEVGFLGRYLVVIPFLFVMFFCVAQYRRERQAEEEYAFKAAVSLTLEPYRELLVKLKGQEKGDIDLVKKLMYDVFDNPVKRLFKVGKEYEQERGGGYNPAEVTDAGQKRPVREITKNRLWETIASIAKRIKGSR